MNWSSWSEFFAMGGYGVYVWGSYIVTLLCVVGEIILISERRRTLVKRYGLIDDSEAKGFSNNSEYLNTEKTSDPEEISNPQEISNKEEIKNETTS
ncbi:MAG: heme exporter protein CcmD [Burkholderiales bacterium]|nr:heme exporter protein CcmD [Burkholderiales bacterium]